MSRRVEVAAGLVFHNGKLLITQRYPDAHLPNLWEFPGGKKEPGETFEQCLARELREELGVEVAVGSLYEEVSHDYPDKKVFLKFFLCKLLAGEAQPLGCQDVAWISPQGFDDFEFPEADARLLAKLRGDAKLWQ